jgi:hypothetical protein
MSRWEEEKAERNRRSLGRLTKALPCIFPSAVLSRALARPFVPPTPRLAIDSYWSAHPLRADRLARALAAGAERRVAGYGASATTVGTDYRAHSAHHPRLIGNVRTRRVRVSAACAGKRFIASVGMSISGTLAQTRMQHGTVPVWSHGNSGMRRAVRRGSCAVCKRVAAAKPVDGCGRPPRLTIASRFFGCGTSVETIRGRSFSVIGACQIFR